jgi:hypothetical protein
MAGGRKVGYEENYRRTGGECKGVGEGVVRNEPRRWGEGEAARHHE